jgi:hypothetical protein
MIGTTLLANALRLPHADIVALSQGRIITALPPIFISLGQSFALFPDSPILQKVHFWARCELCKSIDNAEFLDILSQHTPWSLETLMHQLAKHGFIFLAFLRVYKISEPISILAKDRNAFLPLIEPVMITNSLPILSNSIFNKRQTQLDSWEFPLHLELEALQNKVAHLTNITPAVRAFDEDLQIFLEWRDQTPTNHTDSDLAWIRTIANIGNSSNGNDFEKLVRKSLVKLGFANTLNNIKASLEPETTGGAGGIDVYCNEPFSLVGECKATKYESVSNGVSAQLINLGISHLGKATFDESVKVIFAAGNLTSAAEKAAYENHMNVIRPETLQRLTELKAKYPGSINLQELENCLRNDIFGEASDQKVNRFIETAQNQVKLRAHIAQLVKSCQERLNIKTVDVSAIHTAYALSDSPNPMKQQEILDILIELSSPLTGYLGRVKDTNHFYTLREYIE